MRWGPRLRIIAPTATIVIVPASVVMRDHNASCQRGGGDEQYGEGSHDGSSFNVVLVMHRRAYLGIEQGAAFDSVIVWKSLNRDECAYS